MAAVTVAEVDLSAIRANVRAVRERVGPNVRVIPAVKANAYGHGAVEVSRACLRAGANMLGVANVDEALELRAAGIDAPVLILGCSMPDSAGDIVSANADSTVCELSFGLALSDAALRRGAVAGVHVKIDTGMGRIGIPPHEAVEFVASISALPGLALRGVFTHFPCSDEPDRTFTLGQIESFRRVLSSLQSLKGLAPLAHASNSGGILAYPEADFDAVRPGIMIYGCYPSQEVVRTIPVQEALTLRTRIVFLKRCPAGAGVSYGRTCTLKRPSIVATLPVGYADGYSRRLSNVGEVAVRGCRAPVIGRVCMDQTMIDVTDVPGVCLGDEVVLYGGGVDYLNVSEIAAAIGTIPYEVLCAIGPRVPRVYLNL